MIRQALSASSLIDSWRTRLIMAWLWWRHTYTFNFAHKALCERFRHNVLRIGHVSVCRSCTLLYASGVATGIAAFFVDLPWTFFAPLFYGLFVAVLALSYPRLYEHFSRPAKDLMRCAAGVVMAMMIIFFVEGHYWLGVLNVVLFAFCYRVSLNEYRRWKLRACDGCPELGCGGICSGYRAQADKIRKYEAAAEEYLIRRRRTLNPGTSGR